MNILFAAKHYFGNPDLVRLSLELTRRKHQVSVVTSLREVDKLSQESAVTIFELKPLITIHSLPYSFSFPFSKINSVAQKQDIDVIHALHDYSTNTATAAVLSWVYRIPFVYTIQGIGAKTGHLIADRVIEFYDKTVERVIAGRSRKVLLLSPSLMSRARELGVEESKTAVVPSGVDSEQFDPDQPELKNKTDTLRSNLNVENKIVLGYVGRLIPAKGLSYLLMAAKRIRDKFSNIVLLVIGDGPQRETLEAMAKDLEIETIFAGWQSDVAPYYALMDIFVLPSFFEGLPNVVLEAMAMKKPVIATDVGGNPDLLLNGENGFLVPIRNVSRLASALTKLVESKDMRARMGTANRQKVEKDFQWSSSVDKVEKVYSEVAMCS